jgi:hypothetical protein
MSSPEAKALAAALHPLVRRLRTDVSAVKREDGSRWTTDPLTPALLEQHVNGGPARGAAPIKPGESVTMVGLLDFDSHKGEVSWDEMTAVVAQVIEAMDLFGLRAIPFRSSGGSGVHLIAVWDTPQDAYSVREALCDALESCGLRNGARGVKYGQVEVFPKQDSVDEGDWGNQFILPLGGKSEPLDALFLSPMGKLAALGMSWPASEPVVVRERPVRVQAEGDAEPDPLWRIERALFAIPNSATDDIDYDAWYRIVCAAHEAGGGTDEVRDVVERWSAQNPKHDRRFFERRVWPYIRSERRGAKITRATLYRHAQQHELTGDADGFEEVTTEEVAALVSLGKQVVLQSAGDRRDRSYEAKERWRKAILDAPDERVLMVDVLPLAALDRDLGAYRGTLVEVVKDKLASFGAKVSVTECRKMLTPPRREKPAASGHWSDGWVYVTEEDKLFLTDSEELLTMQGFNAKFNRELPPQEDGEFQRRTAAWVALEEAKIPTVTRRVYLPWANALFDLDGTACANLFRPSMVPQTATTFTAAGLDAVERVKAHIALLAGGRPDVVDVLVSWMAFNVQNPGKKIRWAPLIKGVEGDGKSTLGSVMAAVLGMPNVKQISPKVLGTDFTDWAHGASVGVLEEIKLTGHNRYDILNALKPYLTNSHVEIHPKGSAPFNVLNTMNYIAFTNHSDALPLNDTDRRWFIVFTPFTHISEMDALVGDRGAYFDALYDDIEQNREELRKWLVEMPLSPLFSANGSAPLTDEKSSMVAMNISHEEELVTAAIEAGGPGISEKVVMLSAIAAVVSQKSGGEMLGVKEIARVLTKLGWLKVQGQVKWRGKVVRVWVKGISPTHTTAIRLALDAAEVTHANVEQDELEGLF